jgi:apolipoprotein N-acyltransferase
VKGVRGYAVALIAGAALAFAFPETDLSPLAWVAIAPLLGMLKTAGPPRGAALGFVFGIGFFGSLLVWISLVGWVAWALLVVSQSLWLGFFGVGMAIVYRRGGGVARIVAPGIAWVAVEYLRSIVPVLGFTWGELAQSQHNLPWMLRAAAIGGGWGIAWLVVTANALIMEVVTALRSRRLRRAALVVSSAAVFLVAPALLPRQSATGEVVRVAIVQGNVPDLPDGFVKELAIIDSHQKLTEGLQSENPDLVVWPESSVGQDPERVAAAADALAAAARAVAAPMVVGANLDTDDDRYLVMALEISKEGTISDRYQKTHLVPFGEYVPWRRWLDWIPLLDQVPRDAVAGDEPRVFDVAGGPVAPVISYEGDFGSLVRRRIDVGGRLLVVATNTSTWGRSWASAQHVAFSKVRAAENGVWVVHAAISGISAFVAPDGRVVDATELWTADTLVRDIRFSEEVTIYTRTGDWLPIACTIASGGMLLWGIRPHVRRSSVS